MVHLPYSLFQLFKSEMHDDNFLSEIVPDGTKESQAHQLYETILKSVEKDLPFLLPILIKRIKAFLKKTRSKDHHAQLEIALETLKAREQFANNIFLITLLAAKISMKKYWENQRDRFFFFTILKNPLDAKNYYDYGHILLKQKQTPTAEQLFHCAIEIDPKSFWGYWGLGFFFLKNSKLPDAEKLYDSALKLAQQSEIQHPTKFRRELFLIKEDMKKLKEKKLKMQSAQQPQIDLFSLP
jgi:tetratricopeptide (TPR) repeat protein